MATTNVKGIFSSVPGMLSKICNKDICLYCIPTEKGCLVIAILSAIANGVTLLASIILGILFATGIIFAWHPNEANDPNVSHILAGIGMGMAMGLLKLAAGVAIFLLGLGSLIAFIFSVLLCNGISKRRPGQVMSYFIYGVVTTVLTLIASVIELASCDAPGLGIAGLFGCVIYSLFLVLVHQTYTKVCADAVFKDHIHLVEERY